VRKDIRLEPKDVIKFSSGISRTDRASNQHNIGYHSYKYPIRFYKGYFAVRAREQDVILSDYWNEVDNVILEKSFAPLVSHAKSKLFSFNVSVRLPPRTLAIFSIRFRFMEIQ